MPDRPLLIFPTPENAPPPRQYGGGGAIIPPTPERQRERLEQRFAQISQSFRQVAPRVDGLEPEHVVVFEAAGQLSDVARAADRVPGLEWLTEWDLEDFEADDDFRVAGKPDAPVSRRLFALMSNQAAMDSLLALWNDWQTNPTKRAAPNFGPFKSLFQTLRDVRRWSARDRVLDTRVEEYWRQNLAWHQGAIKFEAELWFRAEPESRARAAAAVEAAVTQSGGRKIDDAAIDAIRYHALLLECPAATITRAVNALQQNQDIGLLRCEEVMFFRPVTQAVLGPVVPRDATDHQTVDAPVPNGAPVVALLDGVPLERHHALDGRILVEDPDGFGASYRPGDQEHGTAMASLIIHGDLSERQPPLSKPVYVRPVLKAEADGIGGRREQFPEDRLFLDVFHRAIRRMVVGEGDTPATAPTVKIINLSLGNPWQPFVREMSPLAKLIDWLAWKYGLLFLVSAGNYTDHVKLDVPRAQYRQVGDQDAVRAALRSLRDSRHERRLISPGESMNSVTIGALHTDSSGNGHPGNRIDLMRGRSYTSPMSRLGLGLHKSVKPEILMPGGRQLYSERVGAPTDPVEFELTATTLPPGQLVASPSRQPGSLSGTIHSRGTSNSTALATRLAALVHDNLENIFATTEPAPNRELLPVLVKALLVHASAWSDPDGFVAELTNTLDQWQEKRRLQAQLMGFGPVIPQRALVATDQRVLLVGAGRLGDGEGHRYTLPLPDVLSGQTWRRRLVATVAWLTPLHLRHRKYRRAKLYLSATSVSDQFGPTIEADDKLADHGTVQHLIREIEERRVIDENASLSLQVNCRADAGELTETVPYGFAVTLEVAAPVPVNIYDPIRERLRTRVPVRPR